MRARPAAAGVRRILLTASGGPFRTRPLAELATVTPDEACAHPNWVMGRKISVDSATMMNKGLEVIEAHWLFGAPRERSRSSSIRRASSIRWSSTSTARCSRSSAIPTCARRSRRRSRIPTASTRAWRRSTSSRLGALTFEAPDHARFPCLALAYDGARGRAAPRRRCSTPPTKSRSPPSSPGAIRFTDIAAACAETLARVAGAPGARARRRARRRRRGARVARAWLKLRRRAGASDHASPHDRHPAEAARASSSCSACSWCSTSSATTGSRAGAASRCCASRSASAASSGRAGSGPTAPNGRSRRSRSAAT